MPHIKLPEGFAGISSGFVYRPERSEERRVGKECLE